VGFRIWDLGFGIWEFHVQLAAIVSVIVIITAVIVYALGAAIDRSTEA
jgi:hypothetical protein